MRTLLKLKYEYLQMNTTARVNKTHPIKKPNNCSELQEQQNSLIKTVTIPTSCGYKMRI